MPRYYIRSLCTFFILVLVFGCFGRPRRVKPPDISPQRAARDAIEQYDGDGDGVLSGQELKGVPGMSVGRFDGDGDGKIAADEIASRIKQWLGGAGLMNFPCLVVLDGRLLAGATMTFVPEPFLGDNVKPASATTDESGHALPALTEQDVREDLRGVATMQCSIYKAEEHYRRTSDVDRSFSLRILAAT